MIHFIQGLFKKSPASPGDVYGAPGVGSSTLISFVSAVVIIATWFLFTEVSYLKLDPLFLPSPSEVFNRLLEGYTEVYAGGTIIEHSSQSIFRVLSSFFLAVITAVPIGIAMGMNVYMRGIFDPPIEFYRPIPPLAYLPLTIIWLGIDEGQKITLIWLAMFAPMTLSARAGVRSVQIEQIHAAYSLGASRAQVIRHVVLKAAMPEILTGMRIGIGFGWTTLVAAEMVAAETGLGHMVLSAADFLDTSVVFLGIIIIAIIAYTLDLIMRLLETILVPWKGK